MKDATEKICLCALNRTFGFEPRTGMALLSAAGSASDLFNMSARDIDHILGPYSKFKGQICRESFLKAEEELAGLEKQGIYFSGYTENSYPEILKECTDAPIGLYIRSMTPPENLWQQKKNIAVIGTRDISMYGREWCARITSGLAGAAEKPAIISGLALGTDICAHQTALENGLPTIAVMATGADSIYPYRHRRIAEDIASKPGCALVTDYPPGTPPLPIHFMRRNRIIAGLSHSCILVESKIKGGGMMTSRLAFSYDRDVYALPGRIDDLRSQGCNYLIRNKIAEPITSIQDLLDSMGLTASSHEEERSPDEMIYLQYERNMDARTLDLTKVIFQTILRNRGISIDEISQMTVIPYPDVSNIVNLLETDGFIRTDIFRRCFIIIGKRR